MPIQNLAIGMSLSTKRLETDLKRAQRIAQKRSRKIQRELKGIGAGLAIGLGGAAVSLTSLVRTLGSATTAAKEFGTAMAEVSTLLDDTSGVSKMTKQTRELAKAFGTDHVLQAKARYQVLSGGISDTTKQIELLTAANVVAVGGLATVEETTRGLLSVMNAYGDRVGNAADVSDKFFIAMKQGITTIPELVQSIGGVAGIASQTGVKFNELLAIFAAGTRVSKGAAQTMDALRGAIAAIAKSSSQAQQEMAKLNKLAGTDIEFNIQGLQEAGGLVPFINQIKGLIDEFGDAGSVSQIFGRVEAMNLAFQIMGEGSEQVAENMNLLESSSNAARDAFMKMLITPQKQLDIANAKWNDLKITIGAGLMPAIVNVATEFGNMVGDVDAGTTSFSGLGKVIAGVGAWMVIVGGLAKQLGIAIVGVAVVVANQVTAIFAPLLALNDLLAAAEDPDPAVLEAFSFMEASANRFNSAIEETNTALNFIADDGAKAMEDAMASAARIINGATISVSDLVKNMESIPAKLKEIKVKTKKLGLAFLLGMTEEELKSIQSAGKAAIESLFTPLEQAQAEYFKTNIALNNYLGTLKEGTKEYERTIDAIMRNNKAWVANRKAIKAAITPFQAFVKVLQDQIAIETGTSSAHKQRIELLKIEAAEIAKTADELRKMLDLIDTLNASSGRFGFGFSSIGDVIREAFADGAKDFAKIFKNIKGGTFDQKSNFAADAANYVGDLVNTFRAAKDAGKTTLAALNDVAKMIPIPIVQAVAAIAGLIDDLSGGRLFGTKFKVDKTINTLGIGSEGIFGGTDIFKSKKKALFLGTKRKVVSDPLSAEARKAITEIFDAINEAVGSAARALAVKIPDIIGGTFEQEFDADNNLVKEFSTVLGKVYEESFEEFGKRLISENLIAAIAERFNEVGAIAERWREDATKLLEGANLLLVIAGELRDGFNLFEISFSQTVDIIEELSHAGEELSETYLRLKHDTELLDRATALMGVSLDLSRDNFVRFAAEIEEAAGGIDRATELWVSFFETFTTANERAVSDMETAVKKQAELLSGIGADAAGFAEDFKRLLPTMTAEEIATWLKAGEAIAAVIKLEDILRQQRDELQDILGDTGVFSAFQMELIELQRSLTESLKRAEQLGASERELALIRKHSERTLKRMIADLGASTAQMANTFLEGMSEGQLGFLEEEAKRLEDLSSERRRSYEAELSAIRKLKEFADSLLLNTALTPLTPTQQLAEARSQFQSTLGAARGGDLSAMQNLPGIANSFLDIARSFFASSSDYTAIFDQVQAGLRGVGTTSQYDPLINQLAAVEEEIAALKEVISTNSQAVLDFQNALAITALLENIVALASFGGMTLDEVAASFGLDIGMLTETLSGLGIEGFDPESILQRAALDAALDDAIGSEIVDISVGVDDLNTNLVDLREDGGKNNNRLVDEQKETNRLLNRLIDEGLLSRNAA